MRLIEQKAAVLFPSTPEEGIRELRTIEYAGRNCYRSHDKMTEDSYKRFVTNLMERGHHSPLKFGRITLQLTTSRDVMAEITRHRLCSFAIQSQRYVLDNKEGDIAYIKPLFFVPVDGDKIDARRYTASRSWEEMMKRIEREYAYLTSGCKLPPEDARKILPNSTATEIVCSMNLREFLHILELRSSLKAYPEMRELMRLVQEAALTVFPPFWEWGKETT